MQLWFVKVGSNLLHILTAAQTSKTSGWTAIYLHICKKLISMVVTVCLMSFIYFTFTSLNVYSIIIVLAFKWTLLHKYPLLSNLAPLGSNTDSSTKIFLTSVFLCVSSLQCHHASPPTKRPLLRSHHELPHPNLLYRSQPKAAPSPPRMRTWTGVPAHERVSVPSRACPTLQRASIAWRPWRQP